MPIVVVCPCGRQLQAKDELAGKRVRCPQCGQPVAIPAPRAPAARPGRSPPASGGRAASTPVARAPLGSTDLFGDLSSLENAAANPLSGHLPPGGNPLAGPLGAWDQPQPRKRGPNPILLVGAVGGGVALLILGILFVALLTRDKGVPDTPVAAKPEIIEEPSRAEKPQEEKPAAPSRVPPAVAENTVSPSTPADTAATTTSPKLTAPNITAPAERTWIELAPALASRLGKPESLKGVTVIDSERSLIAGYSWMTHLLPYMGEEQRHQKFNFTKSWSDKVNLQLTGPVEAFLNPADPRKAWEGWPYDGIGLTHFVGISGIEETRNDVAALLPRSDPKAGMFGYEEIARPAQITDGTSQTLMLMGSGALAAPWVQGGGATIRGLREPYFDELTGFGSKGAAEGGTLVMFADGSAKTLSTRVSPQVLRNLATIRGADLVDRAQLDEMIK